ncbi:MAG: response regulator [Spirochaetota bacterium]
MTKLTCVVVDDDELIVEYVKTVLGERDDLVVHGFTTPQQAIGFLKANRTHILVADVVMPKIDGIDLLDKAKNLDPLTHVIMITAYSTVGRVVVSLQHGAADFVLKPFETPDNLIQAINQSVMRWQRWFGVLKKTAAHSEDQE